MSHRNATFLLMLASLSALVSCTTSTREAGPAEEPPAAELAEPGAPSEPAAPSAPAAPTKPVEPAAPNEPAAPSEPVAPSTAEKPAAATKPAPEAPAAPAHEPKAEAPDQPAPAAAGPCGEEGQPMCPLQAFMEKQLQEPLDAGDLQAVSKALQRVAKLAPDPAWNAATPSWAVIANEGATAAASADPDETGASCKACHKAFRKKYKAGFRTRPLP